MFSSCWQWRWGRAWFEALWRAAKARVLFQLFSPSSRLISIIPFAAYSPVTLFSRSIRFNSKIKCFLAFFVIIRSCSNQCVNQKKLNDLPTPKSERSSNSTPANAGRSCRYPRTSFNKVSLFTNPTLYLWCHDISRPQYCRFELKVKLQRNCLNPTSFRRISIRKQWC